jgi:hypothetical protein
MYLDNSKFEKDILRQGDIIKNVLLLGAINLNGIQYNIDQQGNKKGWTVSQQPKFSEAIVLSHSCEIDTSNRIKLTSIILAPLRDINKATAKTTIDELKSSNIINSDTKFSFLKYFYIEPNSFLTYPDGAIIDFSKCFSVKKESYNNLLTNKILSLTNEAADCMALKFGLYFYRNTLHVA